MLAWRLPGRGQVSVLSPLAAGGEGAAVLPRVPLLPRPGAAPLPVKRRPLTSSMMPLRRPKRHESQQFKTGNDQEPGEPAAQVCSPCTA